MASSVFDLKSLERSMKVPEETEPNLTIKNLICEKKDGGRVFSEIRGTINRDRDEGIGRGIGGEGNGDEDRGRGSGSPVESQGESLSGQDGGIEAGSQVEGSDGGIGGEGDGDEGIGGGIGGEGNGDEDRGRGPTFPTFPFSISQASGSGSPVESQGESLSGQDGGLEAGSQVEGSDGGIGGEGNGDEGIGGGIGGGGQGEGERNGAIGGGGEGNGDEGRNEARGRVGDVENGARDVENGARDPRRTPLEEMFIALSAQSTTAVIALHSPSSGARGLLVSVLVTNLVGFVCCTAAVWQRHTSPRASRILGRIGSAATSLGFILMIAMILPPYLLWMIVLACLALLAVFIISFMS